MRGRRLPHLPDCSGAKEQFPESCSQQTRQCHGTTVKNDKAVCDSCYDMLDRLNIGSPIAPCACTYCALQLSACFESAKREPDAGDSFRDQRCQAIVECGWAAGCAGSDCYCGTGVDRDTCLKNANAGHAGGPCAGVIEAAAMCDRDAQPGECVFRNQLMADSVTDRATDVAKCVTGDPVLQGPVIEPKCR